MKIKTFFCLVGFFLPILTHAESVDTATINPQKPLSSVRVAMHRMLTSNDGQYYLGLYAGVAKPRASLIKLETNQTNQTNQTIQLSGSQKGNDLILNADLSKQINPPVVKQMTGMLDANSGIFNAKLLIDSDWSEIQFQPAFKVKNKPVFTFKFYGVKADTPAHEQLLTRVDVINKVDKSVVQSLTGFSAFPNSIGYMDINFDGYYDVILSDLSRDRKIADKRFIYWMYNPKTQKFQRSAQLEKVAGFPVLYGEKKQIDFGEGQVFQVENGLLNPLPQQ